MDQRFVDRDIARMPVLDEEDRVGDPVKELDSGERAPENGGQRRRGIAFGVCARD